MSRSTRLCFYHTLLSHCTTPVESLSDDSVDIKLLMRFVRTSPTGGLFVFGSDVVVVGGDVLAVVCGMVTKSIAMPSSVYGESSIGKNNDKNDEINHKRNKRVAYQSSRCRCASAVEHEQ